ncbi:uncharacterized protein GGS25DRAFT_363358 [Hypoxylon fragiforme]|uniref:uncharacterized protein n=1 Tax=Hypoxylon fragiforme TaxID=63214 RepID=UPI0020C652AA|nr:uncharacterized protein GGS25DRAFT_363358 [Hypoxylon fragiforme]KAI2605933.1 hypothetical protein GGS25DRAFT_363358 [Hypoxylon fragiforme]
MIRDHKAPAGPRPAAQSPTRSTKENVPINRIDNEPMLHASSSNNHSLFSFGRNGAASDIGDSTTSSFEFLPSVSFDDLQSSLESASTEFKLTQFPSPSGHGSILDEKLPDRMAGQSSGTAQNGATSRSAAQPNPTPNIGTRPSRSSSILRRPSTSSRQVSNGSTISVSSSITDAPTAPAAMRNRRQSHYPPVSNTNIIKPPRKSIGPGVIDTDYGARGGPKRRPSLVSNSDRGATESTRTSMDMTSGETTKAIANSRATKARSVQPAPRLSTNIAASSSSNNLAPDQNRTSAAYPRSPRGAGKASTPNSARRMSVMPGTHTSHATGLGARTISPTDAQRMKHSSSMHSTSTGTPSGTPSLEPAKKSQRKPSSRRHAPRKTLAGPSEIDQKINAAQSKKSLQPLRLPPLNLGPLNLPTGPKSAPVRDSGDDGKQSPPLSQMIPKTPTTPMTAPKGSFFSRARVARDLEKSVPRSSSSIHHARLDSPNEDTSSSNSPLGTASKKRSRKVNASPFLSSSAPKAADTFNGQLTKSKTVGDINHMVSLETTIDTKTQQKPSGPRAQKLIKPVAKSPPPQASPEEPPTPSSISNLRRKLSLSWKRSTSKSSHHASVGSIDKAAEKQARQESMPPPRIPISASTNINSVKTSSSNHALKTAGTYLESRRRKSSASSLNTTFTQKSRSDAWTSSKEDIGNSSMVETSSQLRNLATQKIIRPRPSTASIKRRDSYTAELDKDDLIAEDEMKRLAMRKKETEIAARTLDALRKRATPKERVGPREAIQIAILNRYEKGEIVDYNDVYFCGTQNAGKVVGDIESKLPNFGYDDERGDYTIVPGDHLSYRYEIVDVLGKGSFGQVVRCIDHKTGVLVAVKIIRNKKRFHQQALVEVNILQKLREWDPHNRHSMVNFTHSFYFRGHLCISTELLDMNLYEFIKSNSFRGFSLKLIRRFTKQMLSSLNLLKQHKVIHCDLKPENILLRHPIHSEIKVIDFGSSCFENEKVYTYIQSRFYRSPEVILGMTYGLPIDMWSLGCILAELYTGVPIFPGENEQEQLACIMEVFGPPEKHLIEKSTRKKLFFDSMGKPRLTVSSKGRRRRPSSKTLQQALKCDDDPFLDFLARCLRWDPDRRLKPEEAIRHEFITGQKTSVPVPRTRESSPIKRHNTISTPRPLPDPPGVGKGGHNLRPREASNTSPLKPAPGARRTSAFTSTTNAPGAKRVSAGTSTAGGSNLPRVAGRTASGKQDLASVGASVAMSRRA